ncbi:MAG: hypothetical protein ACYS0I_11060 [Planctomycetota bacterium]
MNVRKQGLALCDRVKWEIYFHYRRSVSEGKGKMEEDGRRRTEGGGQRADGMEGMSGASQ